MRRSVWLALALAGAWRARQALSPPVASLDRTLPAFLRRQARRALQSQARSAGEVLGAWSCQEIPPLAGPSLAAHRGALWICGKSGDWNLLQLDRELACLTRSRLGLGHLQSLRPFSHRGRLSGLGDRIYALEGRPRAWSQQPGHPGAPMVQAGLLRLLVSLDPTVVTTVGRHDTRRHRPEPALDHLEPATQVIPFGPGWLLLAREHNLHRFVYLDEETRVDSLSEPFYFHSRRGETCHGLAPQPGCEALVMSFESGRRTYLGRITTRRVAQLLALS